MVIRTIYRIIKQIIYIIAIPLAILIAFSRLYLYVHFPSDILGAVILGLGIGALTLCGGNWADKRLHTQGF